MKWWGVCWKISHDLRACPAHVGVNKLAHMSMLVLDMLRTNSVSTRK